jgi:hypothetical protein
LKGIIEERVLVLVLPVFYGCGSQKPPSTTNWKLLTEPLVIASRKKLERDGSIDCGSEKERHRELLLEWMKRIPNLSETETTSTS